MAQATPTDPEATIAAAPAACKRRYKKGTAVTALAAVRSELGSTGFGD